MDKEEGFCTFKGYDFKGEDGMTVAQEDYLEMIFRNAGEDGSVRLGVLARQINVSVPSASRMVHSMSTDGFVTFEKYGLIYLTEKGRETGAYLLRRHEIIDSFLSRINGTENETRQTELIEHFLDKRTVENISIFLSQV